MKEIVFGFFFFLMCGARAQVTETFGDGNFTANPVWIADTADWRVNIAGQLQSNNTVPNSSFYIATSNTLALNTSWEFFVRLAFNTSSLNYTDIFLTASASDFSASSTTGYFVRIGGTADEIALYRKDASGVVKIIDGADGITNASNNILKIKVVRNATNTFVLYRDTTGTGQAYSVEGSAQDATYTTTAFFGFLVRQSTSSFFQRHYFDDILIQPYMPDTMPPLIVSAIALGPTTVDVLFSEPVDAASAQMATYYVADNGIGSAVSAVRDAANQALVHLTFGTAFTNGIAYTLAVSSVKDLAGNTMNPRDVSFRFSITQRYDVLIHEIMADPSPPVLLPNAEWIELKNISGRDINLQGWKLRTTSAISGPFPSFVLPADSFLIITSTSNAALMAPYGKVVGVASFPALNNEGTTLSIISKEGLTVHAVAYTTQWYGNAVKQEGGWSLEMIDPANPCSGASNWTSAADSRGGTPGMRNSVQHANPDVLPPVLLHASVKDSVTLLLYFDEPLDSATASVAANYTASGGIAVASASVIAPLFQTVQLKLSTPLQTGIIYTISARFVTDCKGNSMGSRDSAKVGLPQKATPGNVVINEILFNPKPGGKDYIELYNRSNKIIDLGTLAISSRSSTGVLSVPRKLTETGRQLFPGEYVVITEDAASLRMQYFVKDERAVFVISSMPSFPDAGGTVVVLDTAGAIIDEVAYRDDWHFGLIANREGVALERINPQGASQDKSNWHSAASGAGYGTPGYRNSQFGQDAGNDVAIDVTPKIFSPDGDGYDDVATIRYRTTENGYVANVTIFDREGKAVIRLVRNQLLGLAGSWMWDGLDENGKSLPVGTYIIYTELFNLDGKKKGFKNVMVLARKRN